MRFLDPKEEVIKIKLTPHGKYLLSHGKFNPAFYSFYDDDIIYDSSYAGNSLEGQNDIEDRILNKTPRFEGQTKFEGAESTVFMSEPNQLEELFPGIWNKINDPSYKIINLERPMSQYYLQNPLGRSDYNTIKAPYFDLNMLTSGAITNVSMLGATGSGYYSDKELPTTFIPQIEVDVMDTIILYTDKNNTLKPSNLQVDDMELFDSYYVFGDGSKLVYDKEKVLFRLEEGNTAFQKDNFQIEVFEIQEEKDDEGKVESISMKKMFYNESEDDVALTDIEYFFDIKCDNEIEDSYYCEKTKTDPNKIKDIFSDNTFICPDKQEELEVFNIYNTDKVEEIDTTGDC